MPGQRYEEDRNVYWHGSPSQEHVGAKNGLHIGTQEAARQALNARIGTPVDGTGMAAGSMAKRFWPDRRPLEREGYRVQDTAVIAQKMITTR